MEDYIIEKAEPESTNQYIVSYLEEKVDALGKVVQVVGRKENITIDALQEKIAGIDAQIVSLEEEKMKINKIITDAKAL